MAKRSPSRAKRWEEAVTRCQANLASLREALDELRGVQEEFEEWRDNLPENLQQSALGEKLEAMCDLDIEGCTSSADEIEGTLEEAESADLPLGFGRD